MDDSGARAGGSDPLRKIVDPLVPSRPSPGKCLTIKGMHGRNAGPFGTRLFYYPPDFFLRKLPETARAAARGWAPPSNNAGKQRPRARSAYAARLRYRPADWRTDRLTDRPMDRVIGWLSSPARFTRAVRVIPLACLFHKRSDFTPATGAANKGSPVNSI